MIIPREHDSETSGSDCNSCGVLDVDWKASDIPSRINISGNKSDRDESERQFDIFDIDKEDCMSNALSLIRFL